MTIDDDLLNYITTPIISNPAVHNGTTYIGVKGIIYALDAQTFEKVGMNDNEGDISIFLESWVFIILSLLIIIIVTMSYLYFSKKRFI